MFDGWTAETPAVTRGGEFVVKTVGETVPYDTYLLSYASQALPQEALPSC